MFRERYQHMSRQIAPDRALIERTIHASREPKNRKRNVLRPAVAAVCLCVLLAVPALAVRVEPMYQVMYAVSPAVAQFFMPVHQADEANGIRMEVESARIHGSTAEIYVTLRDLTGDRIDDTVDLFDSWNLNVPFDSMGTCELASFDADSRTARLYLRLDTMNGEPLRAAGNKVTFTLDEFLSRKQVLEDVPLEGVLEHAEKAQQTQRAEGTDGSKQQKALVPGKPYQPFPVEGIDLTGVGYIDGRLHVQLAMRDFRTTDNHGWVALRDGDGETVEAADSLSFESTDGQTRYYEFVFDVSPQTALQYTLRGDFTTCSTRVEGRWRVTFPLEQE